MTDPNKAMRLIHQAETDHRLFAPMVAGYCLWPVMRYRAWQVVSKIEPEVMNQTFWQRLLSQPYAWSMPLCATWAAVQRKRYRGGKRDVALLTHEAYRTVKRSDGWWDVYLDDIANHAALRDRFLRIETRAFAWTPWRVPSPRHIFADGERIHQAMHRSGTDLDAAAQAGREQATVFVALMRELDTPLDDAQQRALTNSCVRYAKLFLRSYEWHRKLFAEVAPRVVVVLSAYSRHGTVAAARSLGIPVYEFQHGIIHPLHTGYIWGGYLRSLSDRLAFPDHIATYGAHWSQLLLESGFWQRDQIHDIGSARMDWLRTSAANERKQITRGDNSRPVQIIFTTQHPTRANAIRMLREFADLAQADGFSYRLIIKVHRREGPFVGEYRALADANPAITVLSAYEGDTLLLIAESDVHVSGWSTCHYEALGLGTPTIITEFPGGVETADLHALPAVSRVTTAAELLSEARRITTSESADIGRTADKLFRGNAVENAANLLAQAANNKS